MTEKPAPSAEPVAEPGRHFWDVPERLVTPTWAAKRRLSGELRKLVELCVTTDAPEADLESAVTAVRAATKRLESHPTRTFQDAFRDCHGLDDLAVFTDRATFVGQCNPYAPPMKLGWENGVAVATVTFGPPFEGAPGFVHGGIVAAAFDQLFGYLQVRRNVPSLTGVLTVRYLRPTPLRTELSMQARLDRSEGRRHYVTAVLRAGSKTTAEAEAVFVTLEAGAFQDLFESVDRQRG